MPFLGPSVAKVLARLGIDPRERTFEGDQDPENTSCRAEELPTYFDLYAQGELDPEERDVLCCFLLQGLNDSLQSGILEALFAAEEVHRAELAYWMDTSDPDSDNWWPITSWSFRQRRSGRH